MIDWLKLYLQCTTYQCRMTNRSWLLRWRSHVCKYVWHIVRSKHGMALIRSVNLSYVFAYIWSPFWKSFHSYILTNFTDYWLWLRLNNNGIRDIPNEGISSILPYAENDAVLASSNILRYVWCFVMILALTNNMNPN